MREAIIQTSLELGSQLGEEGLTMRGIASRLGVSATALYQHFESKASILREIRVYGIDLMYDAISPALEDQVGPVDKMRQITRRYINFARENKWLYSVLMEHDQLEWAELTPEDISRSLRPLNAVREAMAHGRQAGVWRDDLNDELAAFQLWASVHGLCSLLNNGRFNEKHPAFPITDERSLIDVFIEGSVRALAK
ncbi:Transcriptional regulator, TetR family protein [Enhygromyxa salina]|uniref:Transcriptional regulator, TetR family protein n=1 Tax=Enhygromyxa salina TaxID=215803 RepID=A0A0C2CY93_9BACT|nr:TetR/AcrR family transcriptional regulator [Enhygromyxa salina]KIG15961.1 Transcriptional regulator, TetR family protein [Enhygromyxa salina]